MTERVLIRAVKTRWNTVTEVLARTLEMRDVLGSLCTTYELNRNKQGVTLERYKIEDNEWEVLTQLSNLLHVSSRQYLSLRSTSILSTTLSFPTPLSGSGSIADVTCVAVSCRHKGLLYE